MTDPDEPGSPNTGARSRLDSFAQMVASVYDDVCSGRLSFEAATMRVRALMPAGTTLLDDLGLEAPLTVLREAVPDDEARSGDHSGWNRTVMMAVVLQSVLIGADERTVTRLSSAFDSVLERLPDGEAVRVIDGIVRNMADPLLTVVRMRNVMAAHSSQVSAATADCLRLRIAAADPGGET